VFTISYNNEIPEIEAAFTVFWKKYGIRRTVMFSIVYAIFAFLFINMIIIDLSGVIGWIGAGITLGFIASLWLKPGRARKKLSAALRLTDDETYTASFFDDKIEIETLTASEKTDKTLITLATEEIYMTEKDGMFLLFVNRSLIYVFPKRCLKDEEIIGLREYFKKSA